MTLSPEQLAEGLALAAQQEPERITPPPQPAPRTEPAIEKPVSVAAPAGPRDVSQMEFDSPLERQWFLQHQREAFKDGKTRAFRVRGSFDHYIGKTK